MLLLAHIFPSLVPPASLRRSVAIYYWGGDADVDALYNGGDKGFRESRRRNEVKGNARYADQYTPPLRMTRDRKSVVIRSVLHCG